MYIYYLYKPYEGKYYRDLSSVRQRCLLILLYFLYSKKSMNFEYLKRIKYVLIG